MGKVGRKMKKVILIFLLLPVVSASFLFAGGFEHFLNGAENFVNKGENEINKVYNNGNVNNFVNLYSNLFTLESKNTDWTISDAQNYVKSLLNTLNEPNVNRNRVVQVFLQVSQTACDQNLNYSQTSKMLKQDLENGNQVHASKNSSVISGVQRTPKSQNPSLPTKKFVNSSIAYIVLLGVIGFFLWILGYKILRKIAWNRWFASCLLFLAGFTFSYFVCSVQESVAVVVGIIAGIIGLAIPKYLYYLLAFLTGCEIGYIATMVFMANYGQNRSLAMVIAVVIGILTVKLNRFATILATSMIGSWTLIFATIDVLKIESVKFSLPAQSLAMSQNVLTKIHMVLGEISNQFYYLAHLLNIGSVYQTNFYNFLSVDNMIKQSEAFSFFILWTVLVVLGMAIQYVTSRNKKVKAESTKEKLLEVKSESN